jgi:hypothetical protein
MTVMPDLLWRTRNNASQPLAQTPANPLTLCAPAYRGCGGGSSFFGYDIIHKCIFLFLRYCTLHSSCTTAPLPRHADNVVEKSTKCEGILFSRTSCLNKIISGLGSSRQCTELYWKCVELKKHIFLRIRINEDFFSVEV